MLVVPSCWSSTTTSTPHDGHFLLPLFVSLFRFFQCAPIVFSPAPALHSCIDPVPILDGLVRPGRLAFIGRFLVAFRVSSPGQSRRQLVTTCFLMGAVFFFFVFLLWSLELLPFSSYAAFLPFFPLYLPASLKSIRRQSAWLWPRVRFLAPAT